MQDKSNVVTLFKSKSTLPLLQRGEDGLELQICDEGFKETMRKNAEKQKRMQETRLQSNQSVLRSYRIKK